MSSTNNPGRVAGFLYLLLLAAPPSSIYPVSCSCMATRPRRPTTSPRTSRSSVSASPATCSPGPS